MNPGHDPAVLDPPAGFAELVAERWSSSRTRARRRRRWATTAAVVTVVLLAFVAWGGFRPAGSTSGSMVAQQRSTVEVGDRAVVVAEAGAKLAWSQDGVRWRVRQDAGSAFYRVDTGEPFVVETPEGTIEVKGTCFAVEVHSMKPTTKKLLTTAGLVSSLSVATVVSLYEGRVVVASTDGSPVQLEPGQSAGLVEGHGAVVVDPADEDAGEGSSVVAATGDREAALRNQLKMRRAEVEDLEGEIGLLEDELEESLGPEVGSDAWLSECASTEGEKLDGCSFLDPSQDVLDEMARCGVVKVNAPPLIYAGDRAVEMMKTDLGLEGEEAEAFERAANVYNAEHEERLRQLGLDVGIERPLVERLPWHSLQQLIQSEVDRSDWGAIQTRIAEERAGHVPVRDVADRSLLDRYVRGLVGGGDEFERHLAQELGPQRARQLHAVRDGWGLPGWDTRAVFRGSCKPETDE